MNDANSNENAIENEVDSSNSQEANQGTQENDNSLNTIQNVVSAIDYQKKFSESAKEAQRLFEENKALKERFELEDNTREEQLNANSQSTDNLYPGFDELDEDAKNNIIAYTNTVTNKAAEQLKKDPAYAFALKQYNTQYFDNALQKTIEKYPELAESKDEFKSKYFNVNNVPENIESILGDVAKIHLFDNAKNIGAKEETEKINRVELERSTAGEKVTTVTRSLEDWTRMSKDNPAKFAQLSKEFNDDLNSGKI